jgi:hypothetical protein
MPGPSTTWTFQTLAQQNNDTLEQVIKAGTPITAAEVTGYEFRGWNLNATTMLFGTRKFKKGFYRDPDTGGFWGYNVRVQQGSINEPWVALPSKENPKRFYFFGVSDPIPTEKYPNALVVDYRRWPDKLFIDPVRNTLDYIVAANQGNKDLLLGISYSQTFLGKIFLGYFVLERESSPSGYQGPNPKQILNDAQRKVLRAVLECHVAVLHPTGYNDDLDALEADAEGYLRDASPDARGLVSLLLEKIAVETAFHPFWEWDVPSRQGWLMNQAKSLLVGGKQVRDLLGVLLSLGWLIIYSRPAGRRLFGASPAEPVDRKTGKPVPPVTVKEPDHPSDYLSKKYRVCVIGSGAGGALMAARLTEAGVGPVLVVEAGKWISPDNYPRLRDDLALRQCYISAGIQPALSSPIPVPEFLLHGRVSTINVLQGSLVGGGPAVNNAICLPMPAPQVAGSRWSEWQAAGIPFDFNRLNSVYQIIRQELDLAHANVDEAAGWRSHLFAPNGNPWSRLEVAVGDCKGCGGCNTGCRYGRKHGGLGSAKSYLERARKAGAIIGSELRAERLEIVNGKARRLILHDLRRNLDVSVEADVFVLSAGPLASTGVLARTGLGLKLPLGRRASANVVTPVYGVFPNHVDRPYEPGLQMCYYAGQAGTLLRESWFHYPGSIAVTLPPWFEEHLNRMQDYAKLSCLGVVVPTAPHVSCAQ